MRELAVYYNDLEAGILTEKYPGADYTFQYKEDYINSALPPISATLPKQSTAFNSEHICRSLRIDENDFFGILEAMADKDFIGAVNIRRINND